MRAFRTSRDNREPEHKYEFRVPEVMSDTGGRRGQIEGVGVVLLTAIVILGVGTFGAFYLGTLDPGDNASADLRVVATNDTTDATGEVTVTVKHMGGEPVDDGMVLLRDRDESYPLPDHFEEGTEWETSVTGAPVGSRLHVVVVENATESVVFNSPVTVRDGTPPATPASTATPVSTTTPASTATPTVGGGGDDSGVRDPGFAYLDYDGDRRYDSGTEDARVDLADNDNGDVVYTAPSDSREPTLVVPDSVSGGELRARNGKVRLVADSVDLDVSLTSTTGSVEVVSRSGTTYLGSGDSLYGRNGQVLLASAGDVLADGVTFRSDTSEVSLTGSTVSLSAGTVDARNGPVTIDASGDVDASGASIASATSAVSVTGGTVDLSGATVTAGNNAITVAGDDDVNADGATIHSGTSTVRVTGTTVRLSGATVTSDNRDVTIDATGVVDADGDTVFRSSNTLSVSGSSVDVSGATLESTNRGITLTADAADVDIRNAELTTASRWQDAIADVTGGGTVLLDGFKLDGDKRLDVRPDSAYEPQSKRYKNKVE
jgi:Tfp pilus assembly protein PilV